MSTAELFAPWGTRRPAVPDPAVEETVKAAFAAGSPVEIEIGCGKGKFLIGRAEASPAVQFLGVDRAGKWMKIGQRRGEKRRLQNLRFVKADVRAVLEKVPAGSVRAFHIYFPDPWPKRRHLKRRLVTAGLLGLLHERLEAGGLVEFATDDADYFAAVRRAAADCGPRWNAARESVDRRFRHEAFRTNYEIKYAAAGRPLFYLELEK